MPSIQWRQSARAQALLLAATLFSLALLALLPATSSAHSGHLHGFYDFDGRVPGQPDFKRTGNTTMRYIPSIGQYEVRSPGASIGYVHAESAPKAEGLFAVPEGPAASEEPRENIGPGVDLPTQEDPPICRSTGNRIVILNVTGNAGHDGGIRSIVKRMNWKIANQSSLSSGGSRVVEMVVDCTPNEEIAVHQFSGGSWSTIQDAAARGDLPGSSEAYAVKYLAFANESGSLYGQGGPIYPDLQKNRQNKNAVNIGTAIIYNGLNSWFRHVTIHELMHALGASQGRDVNPTAPYSDYSNHCYDGQDALCYASAGESYCSTAAGYGTPTTVPIDCNKNTYFHAAPPGGSWLASYWNTAQVENPFLAAMPTQTPLATTGAATSIGATSATFGGTVTPRADYGFFRFQYVTEADYVTGGWANAAITTIQPAGASGVAVYGSNSVSVSAAIRSLQSSTDYRYRTVATNDAGQSTFGAVQTFRTDAPPIVPGVSVDSVEFPEIGRVIIHGTVDPNGAETTYSFGALNLDGGASYDGDSRSAGSGTNPVSVSETIDVLKSNTRYTASLWASNRETSKPAYLQFTTPDWSPVAAYSFDESQGNTLTDFAGDHDGAISGATWTLQGKYGSALDFDGADDLVSVADAADLDLTRAFTLEAWVRPDSLGNWSSPISKASWTGGLSGYALAADYRGFPTGIVLNVGASAGAADDAALPTDGSWSHLAFTSDGTTLKLYKDGQLAGTASAIAPAPTDADLQIGHSQVSTGKYFDGAIDEVRIYDGPISPAKVITDRDTPVGLDQPPVAAYAFDEEYPLTDSAGDHDGTPAGFIEQTSSGKYGFALDFDGVNDAIWIPDAVDLDFTDSFTLEAWVRPDTFGPWGYWSSVIDKTQDINQGDGSTASGYNMSANAFNKPAGSIGDGAGNHVLALGASTLPTGSWSHLAVTYDGADLRIYVDGTLVKTKASTINAAVNYAPIHLGHSQIYDDYYDGVIDEVRLYDIPLSQGQIITDLNLPVPVPSGP